MNSAPSAVTRKSSPAAAAAIDDLVRVLGAARVVTDAAELEFHATDVYGQGLLPAAIIRPSSTEQLAAALKAIANSGLPVVPRGGGMSYTDGYLPSKSDSIMVDLLGMDRVVDVNAEDGYVTVDAGCTWKSVFDAVSPHGLRTPYWGPLSGLRATVGGALSQGSMFLGSGRYGVAADSVLGLDVVLVDGTVLKLGAHAIRNGKPFFRNFGPDTLGMFLSDTGALGIKTRVTLKLIRPQSVTRHLSFAYDTHTALLAAMARVAREEVVSECFAFDPGLQAQRMKRAGLKEDVRKLGKVMEAAGGGLAGLKAGVKLVAAGRDFLKDVKFSVHVSIDGRDDADADAKLAVARRALATDGREVENSVPRVMRAEPFAEVNSMLGPGGERWVPVHGLLRFSDCAATFEALEAVFAKHGDALQRHDIDHGYLLATVGSSGSIIEPVMYWPEARNGFHERVLAADYLAKLPKFPPNPAATQAVAEIRRDLARTFMERGAVSFQIGKFYLYQEGLDPTAAAFLRQLKTLVDPQGRMNPGSLGL